MKNYGTLILRKNRFKNLDRSVWDSMNALEQEVQEHQEELASVGLEHELASETLEVLSKTNVYNDTFRIWHDGPFGTINGTLAVKCRFAAWKTTE